MIGAGITLPQLGGEYGLAGSAPPDKRAATLHTAAAATGHALHGGLPADELS